MSQDPKNLGPKFDVKYGPGAAKKVLQAVNAGGSPRSDSRQSTPKSPGAKKKKKSRADDLLADVNKKHVAALLKDYDKFSDFFDQKYGQGAAGAALEKWG